MSNIATLREEAIGYINDLPEDKLVGLLDYMQFLCEKSHPFVVNSLEELYAAIDEGLEDLKHGRHEPFEDTMRDLRKIIADYELQS